MPTLLTSPGRSRRPLPPCGRRNDYDVPHSPFQKLIDGQLKKLNLSYRDVAAELTADTKGKTIHPGTFWIWIHNKNGYPHPKSFRPHHLGELARVLKLDADDIRNALDSSRNLYTQREAPVPAQAFEALQTLIDTLRNVGRARVSTRWVLNLAERLQRGSAPDTGPAPPAPSSRSLSLAASGGRSKPKVTRAGGSKKKTHAVRS